MTAATQIALPLGGLPLDPYGMRNLSPLERGRYYAALDLDSWQVGCIETALRMIAAGRYPNEARHG